METTFSIAISTATALLGVTLSLICFRASLRLRKGVREEGPSFEPDSKRAKLDEAASSNPVAADLVPETETQEASYSEASDASHEWILSARPFGCSPRFEVRSLLRIWYLRLKPIRRFYPCIIVLDL